MNTLAAPTRQLLPDRSGIFGTGWVLVVGSVLAAFLAGCGSPGTPQPPSLKLPTPPTDLTVSRSGDVVTLHWTMPRRATDRVPLAGDQRAVICRGTPCTVAGTLLLEPGVPATYTDALPPALVTGAPRLLVYTVRLENRRQRSAGASNPAYTAAGAAPPAVEALHAEAGPRGIVLGWGGAAQTGDQTGASVHAGYIVRLDRVRVLAAGESPNPSAEETRAGVPQPLEQVLELPQGLGAGASTLAAGWTVSRAVDQDAALNRTYRYAVARVARLTLEGHSVEVSGPVSAAVTVVARDLFPPAVPQGLEAVADGLGRAIDLSWTPDADRDLAGYFVYRREAGGAGAPVRVSGAQPVLNAEWRDSSAQAGVRYAYSVSAVDASGNESARSAEVEETLEKADAPAAALPATTLPAKTPPAATPHR